MKSRVTILIAALLVSTLLFSAQNDGSIDLSSLISGCKIEKGLASRFPRMWLVCEDVRMLVTHQLNLFGHVRVETTEQALEFVRLFTSKESYVSFNTSVHWVEVLPDKQDGIFALRKDEFQKFCPQVEVKSWDDSPKEIQQFSITRCAVNVEDRGLYRIEEAVTRDGHYTLLSKELLFEKAEELGIFIGAKF